MDLRFRTMLCACLGFGLLFSGCEARPSPQTEMVRLVADIHSYAQARQPGFLLVGNGAAGLLEVTGENPEENVARLLGALDGFLTESVFYESVEDATVPRSAEMAAYLAAMLAKPLAAGKAVFTLDYVSDAASAAADRAQGRAAGYVSMTVPRRELDVLPQEPLTGENSRSVAQLAAVRNFVILLNPGRFESRAAYLAALRASPADLLIIDLYYGAAPLTRREVARLQEKPQGGRRLVLAYLSVGEAADYRPYWQKHWAAKRPDWLAQPNPAWPGSYRVKYWSRPWRRILYGSADAYLDEIINAGFDGAFLDVMDAWQTFQ